MNKIEYLKTLKIGDKIVIKKKFSAKSKAYADDYGYMENFIGKELTIKTISKVDNLCFTVEENHWYWHPCMISYKKTKRQ